MKLKLGQLIKKYSHAWTLLYFPIYLAAFFWLENRSVHSYYVFQSWFDTKIPFLEIFVVPYFLWFGFVAVTVGWFFFTDKKGYYRLMAFLCAGMTIFLLWSTILPTRLFLRPLVLPRENLFTQMVQHLWAIDPPICVFPSIHVYNTLGVTLAIFQSERLREYHGIRVGAMVLAILIILATVFLKQHSLADVAGAFALGYVVYLLVYQRAWEKLRFRVRSRKSIRV